MHRLRPLVDLSIRRACAFAALGIFLTVFALISDPVLAFRVGGVTSALAAAALYLAAWRVPYRNVRHTEIYAMLRNADPPVPYLAEPGTRAQISDVLRARLLWHAERALLVPLAFWTLALVAWLLG